ncbi:MAG: restriction endonuclease subunit R [Nitrospira sp. CG24B]|nr:MAG: restriction endonuclease subunit R [Nitrospira sp. CG24B]
MGQAPPIVSELIGRFEQNRDSYKSQSYNETQVRREFLDPFFEALGWDVANKQGHAEAYKDVIHEDAIKIGGNTKAPDYCFRIGGSRKFFLEAKKPAVNVKDEIPPAYQLRRYAWSAKLPLSILTDFEEFAVYDCRTRPNPSDKSSTGRILYLTYRAYLARWDEIASIFTKEAVLKGSFDKYAVTDRKRGTATVDAEFLKEIETWRESLAKNLALRNPSLTVHELNFSVQRTIDRLIFLRICEDRGVEPYGQLQALLNGQNIYGRLRYLYEQADDRYNSGLFHFHKEQDRAESPDDLTPSLKIDDKVLKEILGRLYYPQSPYEFSVLPTEILGQVYEQFLGKVIRLTSGHQAKIEEKPEVKKAGGVYYTPAYIVEYIVKQTVGVLCDGKTPKQIAKLTVLDPACGSGSFLLGAYRYLLTYHRDWYVKDGAEKHRKELFQTVSGEWRLMTQEKKRILLNNIYGVDIDGQAVEVTKLSLLLKVLEGESDETLKRQLSFVHERALPDLGQNIKCGNSLIGPDYFSGQLMPDDEAMRRVNPFDWKTEFPAIMKAGGFDAVVGNPPYVRQESLSEFKDYLAQRYEAYDGVADLFAYFMEKSVALLREGGRFSFIVSSSFLRTTYGEALRRTLKKQAAVLRIVDFGGLAVFENAKDTYVCIPLLAKTKQPARIEVSRIPSLDFASLDDSAIDYRFTIPQERLTENAWSLKSDEEAAVFDKVMQAGKPLGEYVDRKFFRGLLTGLNEAFELNQEQRDELVQGARQSEILIKPFLGGQNIRRYEIEDGGRFLIVLPSGWTQAAMAKEKKAAGQVPEREAWNWLAATHRTIARHLEPFAEACHKRQDKGQYWWELRPCDYYGYFDGPKIIFPDICKAPRFFLDRSGRYLANTAYCLGVDDPYLLGILNSRSFWFAISNLSIPFGVRAGQYRYRLIYQYMEKVPIRVIDFTSKADKEKHGRIVSLVEGMLELHQRLTDAKTPTDKDRLQRQIDATDQEIDRLVYDLYDLTEEEIQIVEAASVASSAKVKENDSHETETDSADRPGASRGASATVAQPAQYPGEGGGSAPESPAGAGEPVHGVREPAGQYGSSQDPDANSKSQSELGSTREFETAEGRLSYSELSERLAVPLVAIYDEILQANPDQIAISSEWLCQRHTRLAGPLFPDWAGRFRDVNVQVGAHLPPPYYEVPIHIRQFCDDLDERLRHDPGASVRSAAEFLAWADWRFQWIHPFKDFNGRIGRVLLAALLYRLRLPHVEMAPSESVQRAEYLYALRDADTGRLDALQDLWGRRLAESA